jgi:hypothetical protein
MARWSFPGPFEGRYGELVEQFVREWAKPLRRGPKWKYHKVEWARRFEELEHEDYEEDYCEAGGDPPPGDLGLAERIAYEDFEAHPERWKYNPEENPKGAAIRVWKLVKPLIERNREVLERAAKIRAERGL